LLRAYFETLAVILALLHVYFRKIHSQTSRFSNGKTKDKGDLIPSTNWMLSPINTDTS
jgi:hypothetical protein